MCGNKLSVDRKMQKLPRVEHVRWHLCIVLAQVMTCTYFLYGLNLLSLLSCCLSRESAKRTLDVCLCKD